MTPVLATDKKTLSITGRTSGSNEVQTYEICRAPFTVGRRSGLDLTLAYSTVSSLHAEVFAHDDGYCLRDLGSTNGTFINGRPVGALQLLEDGDLIQFADAPFRVCRQEVLNYAHTHRAVEAATDLALSLVQFERLMSNREVVPYFQPIVTLDKQAIVGYEVLGRSRLFGLQMPKDMFLAASQLDLEAELSCMMRVAALEGATAFPLTLDLFLNTHPIELGTGGLLKSLRELRERYPMQAITLEVHEAAITNVPMMIELRDEMRQLGIRLAYDDFGVGQSRLVELAEVSPEIVKFDMQLIRDIDRASPRQQKLVSNLVDMVRGIGISPLAEGVESSGEHEFCLERGFELGQGYYYGRPAAAPSVPNERRSTQLV
jgi:EAL domain-containing protein (putative c-di-GMP-specific phosphodiesterase class I)